MTTIRLILGRSYLNNAVIHSNICNFIEIQVGFSNIFHTSHHNVFRHKMVNFYLIVISLMQTHLCFFLLENRYDKYIAGLQNNNIYVFKYNKTSNNVLTSIALLSFLVTKAISYFHAYPSMN